jgi:hypothetical protein
LESPALEQAVAVARKQDQLALWDRSPRPYIIALYEEGTRRLRPLSDDEAAVILNRDPDIAREWLKWSRMTGQQGSLIVINPERALRILAASNRERDEEDETGGLA